MTVHEEVRSEKVPRGFLIAAGALIGATLILVAVSRLTGSLDSQVSVKTAVAEYSLLFEDRADGSVAVLSADDGQLVALMPPGTNGFVRGTLRALVRERRLNQVASQTPFRLVLGTDGSLILHDPETDRRVDLRAFGPANVQAFASLLSDGNKTQ